MKIDNIIKEANKYRSDETTNIKNILYKVGIHGGYDGESGMIPNPYESLFNNYLKFSNELENYYPICIYKGDSEVNYSLILTNDKVCFKVSFNGGGDWFNYFAIEKLINTCLKHEKSKKRFVNIESGDQSVNYIFAEPCQVKKLIKKYKLKLSEVF